MHDDYTESVLPDSPVILRGGEYGGHMAMCSRFILIKDCKCCAIFQMIIQTAILPRLHLFIRQKKNLVGLTSTRSICTQINFFQTVRHSADKAIHLIQLSTLLDDADIIRRAFEPVAAFKTSEQLHVVC